MNTFKQLKPPNIEKQIISFGPLLLLKTTNDSKYNFCLDSIKMRLLGKNKSCQKFTKQFQIDFIYELAQNDLLKKEIIEQDYDNFKLWIDESEKITVIK